MSNLANVLRVSGVRSSWASRWVAEATRRFDWTVCRDRCAGEGSVGGRGCAFVTKAWRTKLHNRTPGGARKDCVSGKTFRSGLVVRADEVKVRPVPTCRVAA